MIDLLKKIDQIESIRVRISSIEPNLITNEIINLVAKSNVLLPHFHIPLQSGSDTILKLMQRRINILLNSQKTMELIPKKIISKKSMNRFMN